MSEKRWTDDERDEAFDRGMETMQRVALELYRRGREPLLEELEEARARNADMRAMLEQVTRERDEARASCPDCAMWAERSARWHDDVQRAERERDEARREADRFRHGCTVEGDFVCPNEYAVCELTAERNFLRALKKNHEEDFTRVCKERDEARAEVEHAYREGGALYEAKIAEREAFRSGAEAMREACARWMSEREGIAQWVYDDALSALPIPEEP